MICGVFFFQAEDGIRDLVRSRGLGDVYKRQGLGNYLKDLQELGFEELIGFEADIPKRKVFNDIWTQDLTVPFILSLIHI